MAASDALLVELGTEELPIKALPGLAQAFFDGVLDGLVKRGIAVERGDAKPLHSPRRLAVLLPSVGLEQPTRASEVLGPYLNIALDADGAPTRALDGFAAKAGVPWTDLERTTDAKGERFVHRASIAGAATADLLPGIIAEAIAGMPIPKPMRWGAHEHAFARPVHWLVVLLGGAVVEASVLGARADRMSRGHRFMHGDKPVWIARPADYVDALRAACVLVDPDERRERIVHQVNAAAADAGGHARIDPGNLEEVVCLVEWPSAIACSFERDFLAVPQEALVATMEANQKFFPVLDGNGRLTERFIGIANLVSTDPAQVARGYERVIRPRFADARFFFDQDLQQGLAAMGAGLAHVTYQAKLGTLADKVARIAALAATLAGPAGVPDEDAARAATLSKNDLQSRLVNEFPELQGIAGRHYAAAAGEAPTVAAALDEAYQPRFAGDAIAPSALGRVLAVAERADTLAGGFAAGLKPTGNKDPFALRRNALGLARTLIEGNLAIDLVGLLDAAMAPFAALGAGPTQAADVYDFVLERLRGYYADRGVPTTQFNAVAALRPRSLADFDRRLQAVAQFAVLPEAEALAAADKRIRNILRKAEGTGTAAPDPALYVEAAERELGEAVDAAVADSDASLAAGDYVAALGRLARLRPQVDAFFDGVMVNVDDAALRANRIALLARLADRLGRVAAIEHLSG